MRQHKQIVLSDVLANSVLVALIAFLFTALNAVNNQQLARKQQTIQLIQYGATAMTPEVHAVWTDFSYNTTDDEKRELFVNQKWNRPLNACGRTIAADEYRAHVFRAINLVLDNANAYINQTADRASLYSHLRDPYTSKDPRLGGKSCLGMIADLMSQRGDQWSGTKATLQDFQRRLSSGEPNPVANWFGVETGTLGWVLGIVVVVIIGVFAFLHVRGYRLAVVINLPEESPGKNSPVQEATSAEDLRNFTDTQPQMPKPNGQVPESGPPTSSAGNA